MNIFIDADDEVKPLKTSSAICTCSCNETKLFQDLNFGFPNTVFYRGLWSSSLENGSLLLQISLSKVPCFWSLHYRLVLFGVLHSCSTEIFKMLIYANCLLYLQIETQWFIPRKRRQNIIIKIQAASVRKQEAVCVPFRVLCMTFY